MEGLESHHNKVGGALICSNMFHNQTMHQHCGTSTKGGVKEDGCAEKHVKGPFVWPKTSSGNGFDKHKDGSIHGTCGSIVNHGMRTTLTGVMLGACMEGMELAVGLPRHVW